MRGALEASITIRDEGPEPHPVRAFVKKLEFLLNVGTLNCIYGVSGTEELSGNVTSPEGP